MVFMARDGVKVVVLFSASSSMVCSADRCEGGQP